jgi:hypothetical protein
MAIVYNLLLLFKPRDRLVIDEGGILDERLSATPIPWEDIDRAERWQGIPNHMVALRLKPGAAQRLRLHPIPSAWTKLNRAMSLPEIGISMMGMNGRFADLDAAMEDKPLRWR